MKIVDRTKNGMKKFKDIKLEDIFRWNKKLYMKISDCIDGSINTYDFTKHRLTYFTPYTYVEVIPAELILHGKGWSEE